MTPHAKFHVNLYKGGFSANRWNICKNFKPFYNLFSFMHLQVRPLSRFLRAMAQTMRYQARVCLLGFED